MTKGAKMTVLDPEAAGLIGLQVTYRRRNSTVGGGFEELKAATVEAVETVMVEGEESVTITVAPKALSMYDSRTTLTVGVDRIELVTGRSLAGQLKELMRFAPGETVRTPDGCDAVVGAVNIWHGLARVDTTAGSTWIAEECMRIPEPVA